MLSSEKSSLEAGLAALKEGNYYAAITQLLPIANNPEDSDIRLQALVGLVMSYAHTGEISKAIALCRNLIESDNSQVQEWAKVALEHLTKRQKRLKSKSHHQSQNIVNSTQITKAQVSRSNNYTNNIYSTTETTSIYWRQARRAKVWQPLRKYNLIPSRLLALATFMALLWVLRAMLELVMTLTNQILDKLPYVSPLPFLYSDFTTLILVLLLVMLVLSPWLLDWLLTEFYQQQPLSKEILSTYSREAVRITQRTCQLKRWPVPTFQILPIAAPMMFTYGNLPRNARIVVSQGLLEKLTDDEIATIYALGLGQINRWDFGVMSLALLVTLPIYQIYQQASTWANKSEQKIWRWTNTGLSSLCYGIWCLLTGTTLLNSRFRLYASDRQAAEITGNPNGLIRALLKITIGIADDIKKQEHTSWQLESLNILAPVDFKHSLCLGSLAGHLPWESLLIWENSNPYRQWFTINNSHPLLGDRLQRLCKIARHWHLETELHFIYPELLQVKPQSFLLQIAPWLGIPLGLTLAGLFWLAWQSAYTLHLFNLKWIYDDWSFVTGFLMIGFSIGTVMRLNAFFPEIKSLSLDSDEQILQLLTNPSVLPLDSVSIRITGKLLGRRGTSNCLAQDLILQSNIGLVKLHHIPWLELKTTPQELIGRQIIVTGWLRRGATLWIDIQTLETQNGTIINSPHPIFSTVLAVIAQAWGAYIMLTAQSIAG
ncbi:M48 family metalloprotease [Sphaerospermopsis torques-reginae]|uniref:M48 family metalloprotease n=1 Tax=Sphaerospermopsis torques-reginae ITEP-024 TaxID=984208 RepID=A0ABX8WVH1_9CYAN|nr:M48 family metalloprotease [Sphaerospermopsis torques-reginae]QYX30399.1 M48 family metalloprotease [Sphaerospermopsis torques-reginae ITEP-024]